MFSKIRAHPGVFVAGAITYAVIVHWVAPKYAPALKAKMPS